MQILSCIPYDSTVTSIKIQAIYSYFTALTWSLCSTDEKHEIKLPPGHTMPPAGQAVGSKCPFLAAEMVQKNNRVVTKASMELQEDVHEMHSVHTGKKSQLQYTCNWILLGYVTRERSLFWASTLTYWYQYGLWNACQRNAMHWFTEY